MQVNIVATLAKSTKHLMVKINAVVPLLKKIQIPLIQTIHTGNRKIQYIEMLIIINNNNQFYVML